MIWLSWVGCDAPIYYPDLGSNQLVFEPEGADTDPPPAPTGETGAPPGDPSVVTELDPGDAPPCASEDPTRFATFGVQNEGSFAVTVLRVDDACVETFWSTVPSGQASLLNGNVGAAWVVRVEGTGEPLYGIVVGADGGALRIE